MPKRYQDAYPETPLVNSRDVVGVSVSSLLTLEYFEAEPSTMPSQVYEQHHILINLNENNHRVENWRNGKYRDFEFRKNEVVVTPAGMSSGWTWHAKSKVIVITLLPKETERFAQTELGILLTDVQLKDIPQFVDEDICQAAVMVRDGMTSAMGSKIMFESLARVFLVKLIQKYGIEQESDFNEAKGFTSVHYKRVIDFIAQHFEHNISLEELADVACISPYHFARLFKQTVGKSPHQYVMHYRVEQSSKMLKDKNRPMMDIALSCGFADQAHFSRVFKQIMQQTPRQFRNCF